MPDIEELLKELPKTDSPKPTPPANPVPPSRPMPPQRPMPPAAPPLPPPPPKPNLPPPPPPEDKFKSLIRTMDQDLEAVKKGMKPESKPFEIKPPPGGPKIMPPPPLPPRVAMPEIKLGPAERTKPLEAPKITPPLPIPGKRFSINPKLLILILIILAVFAGAWWFLTRETEMVVVTPTPTPAPTPPTLFEIFNESLYPAARITISSTDNFIVSFKNSVISGKDVSPLALGRFTPLLVMDENVNEYTLSEIFQKLQINAPGGLLENLDENEWFIVAYGQQETFDKNGVLDFSPDPKIKLGLIAKARDALLLRNTLNGWEATMTGGLKNFFGTDSSKATSEMFLDNIYGGSDVRYRNFPYADNSIDYAIVNLPEFNLDYFILTNSRESIYSAIDLLRAQ